MTDKATIEAAIRDNDNNVSKAARALGVARRTLQNRMRAYGLRGTPGRRKRKLSYSKHKRAYAAAGAVAAVALVGGLILRGRNA